MDYKFAKYTEHDDGTVSATVRFYDGAITTEEEEVLLEDMTRVVQPVTRYRRTAMIEEVDYVFGSASDVTIEK